MAEIVGVLAASHAPLIARDWPKLPPHHKERLSAAFDALGARLNAAKPDVLVIVSPDHWINFFINNLPSICIGVGEEHEGPPEPFLKDFPWRPVPGHAGLANHIYESRRVHYCGNGIYLDEGSAKIVVEKNVVHDCDDGTFFMHYGTSNDIRDNVFANSANKLIGLGRPEKSGPLYFHDNILVPTNPIVYGDGVDDQYHIDRNTIYWNSQTPLEFPNNMHLQQWQQSGRDQHSTVKHESLDVKPYADATNAGREPTAIKLPATQPVAEGYPPAK